MTAQAFRQAARTARLVGHDADAAAWSARADEIFERVMERCWDDWRGGLVDWVRGGEQSAHRSRFTTAWAILTDVGTHAQRAKLLDDLVDPTSRLLPSTTGYGQRYNVEALFHGGRAREAVALVRRYWGAMLERGATTFWESFDPDEDPASAFDMYGRRFATSLCHAWSGAIAGTLATHMLGVTPLAPGATQVAVAPLLGDVAWVEGTSATIRGNVNVRFTPDGGRVEVPADVTARITWGGTSYERGTGMHDVPS
jgi:alpha-L-rhamnosidase